jgi:hypothetical protein
LGHPEICGREIYYSVAESFVLRCVAISLTT